MSWTTTIVSDDDGNKDDDDEWHWIEIRVSIFNVLLSFPAQGISMDEFWVFWIRRIAPWDESSARYSEAFDIVHLLFHWWICMKTICFIRISIHRVRIRTATPVHCWNGSSFENTIRILLPLKRAIDRNEFCVSLFCGSVSNSQSLTVPASRVKPRSASQITCFEYLSTTKNRKSIRITPLKQERKSMGTSEARNEKAPSGGCAPKNRDQMRILNNSLSL